MNARFTVLASGSSGNAALLEVDGFGLLIDCGLPPRTLAARFAAIGASWNSVHAVVLTHTHGDHWKDATLAKLRSSRIPLFAHEAQLQHLNRAAMSFDSLQKAGLTRTYSPDQPFSFRPGLACRAVPVPHDADPTFAFRLEHFDGADDPAWAIGHASDLGYAPESLPDTLAGVDVLAIEYNHDEQLQRASARPAFLINRVLGDHGHLSNRQAADLTRAVLSRSGADFPRCLIQLHLSRECNTPALALQAGREAIASFPRPVTVVTTRQDVPSRSIPLERSSENPARVTLSVQLPAATPVPMGVRVQPRLPGFEA